MLVGTNHFKYFFFFMLNVQNSWEVVFFCPFHRWITERSRPRKELLQGHAEFQLSKASSVIPATVLCWGSKGEREEMASQASSVNGNPSFKVKWAIEAKSHNSIGLQLPGWIPNNMDPSREPKERAGEQLPTVLGVEGGGWTVGWADTCSVIIHIWCLPCWGESPFWGRWELKEGRAK